MAYESWPSNEAFPTLKSNPTIAQAAADPEATAMLDAREVYLEAHGFSVDRNTGIVTAA